MLPILEIAKISRMNEESSTLPLPDTMEPSTLVLVFHLKRYLSAKLLLSPYSAITESLNYSEQFLLCADSSLQMARQELEDDFGKLMIYTQEFSSRCPLNSTDSGRLCTSQYLTLSSSSDPFYGEDDDTVFQGNEEVSFEVINTVCHITIGNRTREIRKISELPVNDRVLHFCWQMDLGPTEKKVIKAFTRFLKTNNVQLTGKFACLQSCRPEITEGNILCEIEADRPVPLHVPSMSESWSADEIGVLARERDEGRRLYHFHTNGYDDKGNIRDRYIYAGGDFLISEPRPPLETMEVERLVMHAFIIKCLAVEWLKLLKSIASHTYIAPQASRLEQIVKLWKDGIEDREGKGDHEQYAAEIKRIYGEIERIEYDDSNYSEGLHKSRAGLEYCVSLEAILSVFIDPDGRSGVFMKGGKMEHVHIAAYRFEKKLIMGPTFDLEASIHFAYGWRTAKRVTYATKRGKTLPDVSRLLGLGNVYELRPYLQAMNYQSYVAGGCFVFRKEMERGHDIEDANAFHFKVKELLGYVYSSRLSRRFIGLHPVEVSIEGNTVYYRTLPPAPGNWRGDSRLTTDCLEKYVGGAGYDPHSIRTMPET